MSYKTTNNTVLIPDAVAIGDIIPDRDGVHNLGDPTHQYANIYGVNVTGSLSDPIIETNSLKFPLAGPQDVRFTWTSSKALTLDDNAGGNMAFTVVGSLTVSSATITTLSGKIVSDLVTGPSSVTTDQLTVYNGATGKIVKAVPITIDPTTFSYKNNSQVGLTEVLQSRASGDAFSRHTRNNYGDMTWGPGTGAADTRLRQTAVSTLTLDNNAGGAATFAVDTATVTTLSGRTVANMVQNTSTSNNLAIAKFTGTGGKDLQTSGILIDASNNITGAGTLNTRTIASLVDGPASATANSIPRQSGTTGKTLTTTGVTIDNSNNIAGAGSVTATSVITPAVDSAAGLALTGATSATITATAGNISLATSATGRVQMFVGLGQNMTLYANDGSPAGDVFKVGEAGTVTTNPFFSIGSSGFLGWGDATTPIDAYLWRTGVKTLSFTNNASGSFTPTDTKIKMGETESYSAIQVQEVLAAAGANQAAATNLSLTKSFVYVNSGAGGIRFNSATVINTLVRVRNNTGSSVNVYPATGGTIDALGLNNPYVLTAGSTRQFHFFTTTQIYSF